MRIVTLPNALTAYRLFASPCIPYLVSVGHTHIALILAISAALSDLDGVLARFLDQRSDLGGMLDPIADFMLITCLATSLFAHYGITTYTMFVYGLPCILISVYAVMVGILRCTGKVVESSWAARKKTAVLMTSLSLIFLAITFEELWFLEVIGVLGGWFGAYLTLRSLESYR